MSGMAIGDQLHPPREVCLVCGAVQCGFCTPGFLYDKIVPAPRDAAGVMQGV